MNPDLDIDKYTNCLCLLIFTVIIFSDATLIVFSPLSSATGATLWQVTTVKASCLSILSTYATSRIQRWTLTLEFHFWKLSNTISQGRYCGQSGYGYVSFERFVRAAQEINDGKASAKDFDDDLPTGRVTEAVTAILEAGRLSLDNRGCKVQLVYNDEKSRIVELKLSSDGK